MVNEPLTVAELAKSLDDCPKDMIQSAIDVLQVFGVVIQVRAKQGYRADVPAGTVLYCLTGFAKGPTAVPLEEVPANTKERMVNEAKTSARLKELSVSAP